MGVSVDKERIKVYIAIGLAYMLLWVFGDLMTERETFFPRVINNFWLCAYLTVLNFITYEYFIPFIKLSWKRLLITPILAFAILMLYAFGLYAWRAIGIGLNLYTSLREHPTIEKGVEYHFPYAVGSIVFFGIVRYTYEHRKLKETAQRLRIEKQEAELNYLKSQTNPHFLFNTLNNIYSLSRDKSDLAPESILRLSKILRYMLYETSGDYIAVEQELKIVNDYIELEKLRYDDSLSINFNYDIEDLKQALPPLLLIPLVENAFKHGVSETTHEPFVSIHLSIKRRLLTFVVTNSAGAYLGDEGIKESIGLTNLRRQLHLLYADYNLNIQPSASVFTATLKINLASHV